MTYLKNIDKICEFNKNLDVNIYHFTTENLTNTENITNTTTEKKINYKKITSSDNIQQIIEKTIDECNEKNILIITDSILIQNISGIFNKYLENNIVNKEIYLHNISIINYTNDNTKVIHLVYNKDKKEIFHKIVNVFPKKEDYFINDTDFFKNISLNRNISKTIDTDKTIMYTFKQKGGEIKNITIRIMNTDSKSTDLTDQWWFKWYFHIHPCANIRLLQSSGTCWVNSAINSLFLVEKIANFIKKRYNKLSDVKKKEYIISLKDFNDCNYKLEQILFSLVYNLIINKIKAKTNDGNFIGYLASRIKCKYKKEKEQDKCKDINYGDGGDSGNAIKIIIKYLLKQKNYLFLDIEQIIYQDYNKLFKKYEKKNKKLEKIIDEYNLTIKMNQNNETKKIIDELKIKYDELNLLIENLETDLKKSEEIANSINLFDIDIDNNKIFENIFAKKTPPIIIFKGNFNLNIKKYISLNEQKYELCSSTIILNISGEEHVISGIICDNISYVYDSNNIFVATKWYNGENGLDNYFSNNDTIEFYGNKIKFSKINCIIYIKI